MVQSTSNIEPGSPRHETNLPESWMAVKSYAAYATTPPNVALCNVCNNVPKCRTCSGATPTRTFFGKNESGKRRNAEAEKRKQGERANYESREGEIYKEMIRCNGKSGKRRKRAWRKSETANRRRSEGDTCERKYPLNINRSSSSFRSILV